ncbi:hypothetical protein NUU61_009000 [Penicillium alfredii]|uniref:Chromosome segregation ATPase family protein n=1 Tax=Penicillium alfredii TaxID=1506179 RepID=A0A9W9JWY9_9EURO|nr:uncharacterized protein NUU61_009000 [Penicillium alfredii]KAJ5084421.1 hypothetical protein NUU61_009000 [Penicillium alfredii]
MPSMNDWKHKLKRRKHRWDSSDPDRAPPPLPLNPRSMSPATKSNVSPNIQAVAAKFADKPSENAPSSYTTNPMPLKSSSPERSLVKGHYHKRMQPLQPGDSRGDARSEFMNYLESRSPERPLRTSVVETSTKQQETTKSAGSPTSRQESEKETANYSVASRYLSRPILGESTPPSATMLALQNMQLPVEPDPPSPSKPPKMISAPSSSHEPTSHSMETLSSQIHSLTDIASNLQREMSNLSRRSKDNATDLISLKAATNSRDEDIRKSLKDLSSSLTTRFLEGDIPRFDLGDLLKPIDGINAKEPDSSPNSKRSYSAPRMPSPNPFATLDRDVCGSPAPISDGSASIALLEKVLREMATKEGEEKLLELVDEIKSRPAATPSDKVADTKVTNMLEEILNLVKEDPTSRALVRSKGIADNLDSLQPGDDNIEGARPRPLGSVETTALHALAKHEGGERSEESSDEILNILRSVKNSVIEGGGMTNGVKALVRELRGEVLGMGRNLARKLEDIESNRANDEQQRSQGPGSEEIAAIVEDSLQELRDQLAATMNESRHHSSALSELQSTMNSAEIYSVVKRALDEIELPQPQSGPRGATMEKDDILETVREAWETYKPEIELQNFGLERDEILDCLSEGLKSYQPQHEQAVTYDQVLAAVQTGLQNFVPPMPDHPPSISRDEIILTIRECLEKPEPATRSMDEEYLNSIRDEILNAVTGSLTTQSTLSKDSLDSGLGHDEIVSAISDGLEAHFTAAKEIEEPRISKVDVVNAVNDAFNVQHSALSTSPQANISRDEILHAIAEGMETSMNSERSALSTNAEPSISREEILHVIADGIESSITAQQATLTANLQPSISRDEILNAIADGVEGSINAQQSALTQSTISRDEILHAISEGLETSANAERSALSTNTEPSISREEILHVIADGIESSIAAQQSVLNNSQPSISRDEILHAITEGLEISAHADQSALATNAEPSISRGEILQAIADGIESTNSVTREIELNKDDLMDAISSGLHEATNSANANVGEQVLERLQDLLDGMKEEFKQYSTANGKDTEQVLDAIKDGLHVVRKEIESYTLTAADISGKHEIIDTVKEGFRLLQADMEKTITDTSLSNESRGVPDTPELLDAMEKEFEHLRQTIGTLLVRDGAPSDKDEILDAIRDVFDPHKNRDDSENVISAIKAEFENLRDRIDMSVVRSEPGSEKNEIIAALQEHFDTLRDETSQRKDGNESMLSATSELLDAFNDGIDSIRDDLKKVLDKPAEFDSAEILDTIKDGLADLKLEMDSLRQSQKEKDDASTTRGGELMLAQDSALGGDVDSLKTLITQLYDKVEAIDSTPRAAEPSEDSLKRSHLDEVLVALQEVQITVADIGTNRNVEGTARKEDTDAIENLLMSTKAQIEDMVFPSPDEIATSEQIGTLERIIREAKDSIADLSARLEAEAPTKSEIGTLEGLIKDVWVALDELKGKTKDGEEEQEEGSEKLLKTDLQTVEAMIFEVKSQVDELKLPDVETLPTKSDIQDLSALVTDFREKLEAENEQTAQGFEARKVEHAGLAEKIEEAKFVVSELGDDLKRKLDGSSEGLSELKQVLEGLAVTAENFSTVENIKELTDLINREFERARGEEEAGKLEKEERDVASMVKHDETRAAIIVELGAKIDEKVSEVLAKYDDAHASLHSKFSESEERDLAHTEAVTGTKALAEDIKLVIGAMGNSVNESCERIGVDTKTLFERVEESQHRMEEMHNEAKAQQEQSRADTERAAAATDRVESKLLEFHPQILETVQHILEVVSQHYDHSQKSAEEFKTELSSLPSTIPNLLPALPPAESDRSLDLGTENNPVHDKLNDILEHAKNNQVHEVLNTLLDHSKHDQLHEKLDRALDQGSGSNEQIYDKLNELLDHATNGNGPVHEKLDVLLSRTSNSTNSMNSEHSVTQMMKLDEMHKDIMENSRRMNEMFTAQSVMVAEENERKRREAEDAAIALERRVAQREQVEADIVGLNEEKDSLLSIIHTLKAEKEEIVKQNAKMSKDLSGLETALEIRHEEMQQMEDRADGLEKRILEGVLDHARTVLLSRSNSVQSMNLKRNRNSHTGARSPSVTSTASTAKDPRDSRDNRSLLGNGVGMALKRRMPTSLQCGTTAVQPNIGKERRILSLSHVTGNRGAERQVSANSGITNLKRSHSVKSNYSLRKASWGGRSSVANKENEAFPEEEEPESGPESDAGTERRTSYTGTCTDSMMYGTESVVSAHRRASGMSSTTGLVTATGSVAGEDHAEQLHHGPDSASESEDDAQTARGDDDNDELHDAPEEPSSEFNQAVEAEVLKLLAPPSDSGLGTDMVVSSS